MPRIQVLAAFLVAGAILASDARVRVWCVNSMDRSDFD